ncbi:MAG TPA: SAM-dependent methyltransferase [Pseudonocardiaceae bacterium]|nr:SAM-dependent methyltransferase [Pseudonocardiaceae bacterium]
MAVGHDPDDVEQVGPPTVIDTTKASIARVYDAFLDGTDNYEVDRQVMNDVLHFAPQSKLVARALRRWLLRVIRYLATAGIDQFLDCGSGLPTVENTHQVAQRHNPDAVVVYVDIDPIVSTHARALLVENDRTHFVQADVRGPKALLAHPTVTKNLDFTRPIGLIQCAIMHHIDDEDQPTALMAEYIDAMPSGSLVALAHFWDPEDSGEASALAHRWQASFRTSSMGTGRFRTRAEIEAMMAGLDLLEPGLVELDDWWPDGPLPAERLLVERLVLGAVGRKP